MPAKIYSVSELVYEAKLSLEAMYAQVGVEGEISNLNCHSSGHCYFTLKDAGAQLSVVLFRDDAARLRFRLENGLKVILQGRLTVYPPQGRFQMVATLAEPAGKGALQLAFEQLKAKLEKEGLFEASRKRPLPAMPQWVGIVTSIDGAALRDILTILNRRFAGLRIMIVPVRVQGEGAAEEIAQAIHHLNRHYRELDVILVGRGGGSLEDLWAFNEEVVARAIAASQIHIISCVGHETDFTIADFVADLRAPTPSAAAELVIRSKQELQSEITHLVRRLSQSVETLLIQAKERLNRAQSHRLLQSPLAPLQERQQDLDLWKERLSSALSHRLKEWDMQSQHGFEKLHLLSPLATLSRGYAIAWKMPERELIKSAAQVANGDGIEVQLREGKLHAQIERTEI